MKNAILKIMFIFTLAAILPAAAFPSSIAPAYAQDDSAAYEDGFRAFQRGDYENAAAKFSKVAKEQPSSQFAPQAAYYLGHAFLKLKKEKEALEIWDTYFEAGRFIGRHSELFKLYENYKIMDEKIAKTKKRLDGPDAANYQMRADYIELLIYTGKVDEAVLEYKGMITRNPSNYFVNKSIADLYVKFKRYKDALPYYEKLLEIEPNNDAYLEATGNAYFQMNEPKKALEYWYKIIAVPGEWHKYNTLANVLQAHNMHKEALAVYEECQKKSGNPTMYYNEMAELYEVVNDYEGLMDFYFRTVSHSQSMYLIIENRLSETLKKNEDSREPICLLIGGKMAEKAKANVDSMKIAVLVYVMCKKYDLAVDTAFNIMKRTNMPEPLERLATVLNALGETNLAVSCLEKLSVAFAGTDSEYEARYRIATFLARLKKYDEAVVKFKAVMDDKNFSRLYYDAVREVVAIYFDELNMPEKAVEYLKKLDGATEQAAFIRNYETLYSIYRGDYDSAEAKIELFKKSAAEQYQDDMARHEILNDIYRGTYEAALDKFRDALGKNPALENASLMLRRMALIKSGSETSALASYFEAERMYRLGSYDSAETLLKAITSAEVALASCSQELLASVYYKEKKYDEYKKTSAALVKKFGGSNAAADALYNLGRHCADIEKNKDAALSAFETILKDYPNCLLINKTREAINKIGGGRKNAEKKRASFFGYN